MNGATHLFGCARSEAKIAPNRNIRVFLFIFMWLGAWEGKTPFGVKNTDSSIHQESQAALYKVLHRYPVGFQLDTPLKLSERDPVISLARFNAMFVGNRQ